jgi:hypothetical protein
VRSGGGERALWYVRSGLEWQLSATCRVCIVSGALCATKSTAHSDLN